MVSLDDVSVFIAVVEKQSFSAAARALNISSSAASKRIGRLESDLRAKLINRTSRRVSLTAAGTAFFEKCAAIRPIVEGATRAVEGLYSAPGGKLRVHASTGLGIKLIAPLIPQFQHQYPELAIDLITHANGPNLVSEDVDVYIGTPETTDKTLGYRDLGVCHYAVCAAPDYLHHHGTPQTPRDLERHNCLLYYENGQIIDHWPFESASGRYEVAVRGTLASNNSAALYEALVKGRGIALLPVYAVSEDVRSGGLTALFRKQLVFSRALRACYPRSPHLPINIRLFLDFIAGHVKGLTLEMPTRRAG